MQFQNFKFRDYYHKFVVFEADELTEKCKEKIAIQEEDCFILCYGLVSKEKRLQFAAIAVGTDWDHCHKGLANNDVLALYDPRELQGRQVRIYQNQNIDSLASLKYLEMLEDYDPDLQLLRNDSRFDSIRNQYLPDMFLVGVLAEDKIQEFYMEAMCIEGPFVVGRLHSTSQAESIPSNRQLVRALPYHFKNHYRLLALFIGDELAENDQKTLELLLEKSSKIGLDLLGNWRS